MIRKSEQRQETLLENMFGGQGKFLQHHILNKDEMMGLGRLCADCTLEPGGIVGAHTHHGDNEVCYFISGKGRVTTDNEVQEVGPGDMNYCCDGHSHKIENIGDEPLRYLAFILYTPNKEEA